MSTLTVAADVVSIPLLPVGKTTLLVAVAIGTASKQQIICNFFETNVSSFQRCNLETTYNMTEEKEIKDNDSVVTKDMDEAYKMNMDKELNKQKNQCELCCSTFSTSLRLLKHLESVHFNLRKWKCEKCMYSTNIKHVLNVHVKVVHDRSRTTIAYAAFRIHRRNVSRVKKRHQLAITYLGKRQRHVTDASE
jgi:hypothetical protein